MWGIEHTIMSLIATGVIGYLFVYRPFWALCAVISQVPFWAGSFDYFLTGLDPIQRNLAFDIGMCAVFLLLAHITGRFACILLCIIGFSMALLDLLVLVGAGFYLELHEALHYAALIVALGGHRARGFDGFDTFGLFRHRD